MSAGKYISGTAHAGLVLWLLSGWGLDHDPLPTEVTQVSVVSGEEFANLVAATTPNPGSADPATPVAPPVEATPAPAEPVTDTPPPVPETPQTPPPPADETPPPPTPEPVPPPAEVTDTAPPAPDVPLPPPSDPTLPTSTRPTPRPSTRVAPQPVAPTEDTQVAEVPQDAIQQDAERPTTEPVTEQDAVAPPEASTQITPEAPEPPSAPEPAPVTGAVTSSARPSARPSRPAAPAQPTQTAETQPAQTQTQTDTSAADAEAEAIAAALAEATANSPEPAVAQGPPMTGSEKESFRVAVNACWNVDPGAEWARVSVTVGFSLDQTGKVSGDPSLLSFTGGTDAQAQTAFQAARRAILRCQSAGYQLPADKYDQWQNVEITFDPSGMRLR